MLLGLERFALDPMLGEVELSRFFGTVSFLLPPPLLLELAARSMTSGVLYLFSNVSSDASAFALSGVRAAVFSSSLRLLLISMTSRFCSLSWLCPWRGSSSFSVTLSSSKMVRSLAEDMDSLPPPKLLLFFLPRIGWRPELVPLLALLPLADVAWGLEKLPLEPPAGSMPNDEGRGAADRDDDDAAGVFLARSGVSIGCARRLEAGDARSMPTSL